jgi:hypothetical protein
VTAAGRHHRRRPARHRPPPRLPRQVRETWHPTPTQPLRALVSGQPRQPTTAPWRRHRRPRTATADQAQPQRQRRPRSQDRRRPGAKREPP